jgi:hypothetical protein
MSSALLLKNQGAVGETKHVEEEEMPEEELMMMDAKEIENAHWERR